MFERCDSDTQSVIDAAADEARRRGHRWLGTEHILLALSPRRDSLPQAAAVLLPAPEALSNALAALGARPARRDVELLRSVGVELEQVRSAVRQTFGEEAVARLRRPVRQPWQPWRRPSRRCTSMLAGELGLSPRVKRALEAAARDAGRRRRLIDPRALLLGVTEVDDSLSNRLLRSLGVDPQELRAALRDQ